MLHFGILPASDLVRWPDHTINTVSAVDATLDFLDPSGRAKKCVSDVRAAVEPGCAFGFSDLVPLATGMLRRRGQYADPGAGAGGVLRWAVVPYRGVRGVGSSAGGGYRCAGGM